MKFQKFFVLCAIISIIENSLEASDSEVLVPQFIERQFQELESSQNSKIVELGRAAFEDVKRYYREMAQQKGRVRILSRSEPEQRLRELVGITKSFEELERRRSILFTSRSVAGYPIRRLEPEYRGARAREITRIKI